MTENGRFGLVFTKTGSINSGTVQYILQNKSKGWIRGSSINDILLVLYP
jgi:hypothetical protein